MNIAIEELRGLIGMTISFACAIVTVLVETSEIYTILAGLGGFLAGSATAYYYYQKALLIRDARRKSELARKETKNL